MNMKETEVVVRMIGRRQVRIRLVVCVYVCAYVYGLYVCMG